MFIEYRYFGENGGGWPKEWFLSRDEVTKDPAIWGCYEDLELIGPFFVVLPQKAL
jgi:hypothetical protein